MIEDRTLSAAIDGVLHPNYIEHDEAGRYWLAEELSPDLVRSVVESAWLADRERMVAERVWSAAIVAIRHVENGLLTAEETRQYFEERRRKETQLQDDY